MLLHCIKNFDWQLILTCTPNLFIPYLLEARGDVRHAYVSFRICYLRRFFYQRQKTSWKVPTCQHLPVKNFCDLTPEDFDLQIFRWNFQKMYRFLFFGKTTSKVYIFQCNICDFAPLVPWSLVLYTAVLIFINSVLFLRLYLNYPRTKKLPKTRVAVRKSASHTKDVFVALIAAYKQRFDAYLSK